MTRPFALGERGGVGHRENLGECGSLAFLLLFVRIFEPIEYRTHGKPRHLQVELTRFPRKARPSRQSAERAMIVHRKESGLWNLRLQLIGARGRWQRDG